MEGNYAHIKLMCAWVPALCRLHPKGWSRLVVPSLAVTEICHLLAGPQRRGRTELAAEFCAAVAADGAPVQRRAAEVAPRRVTSGVTSLQVTIATRRNAFLALAPARLSRAAPEPVI